MFEKFPEILLVEAMYKLIDLTILVFLLLVMCVCVCVCVCVCLYSSPADFFRLQDVCNILEM